MSDTLRVLLMTSTDRGKNARAGLTRLAASLELQGIEGDHVVVSRGDGVAELPVCGCLRTHVVDVPYETTLARARNVALDYAQSHGLLARAEVVGFPDDDCEYPDGLLYGVAELLSSGEALVSVPYAPGERLVNRRRFPEGDRPFTPKLVMQAGSGAASFLTGAAVRAIGGFDERYGLGARFGASEDTDYILRAVALGLPCRYRGSGLWVRHPYKPHRPAEYYLGNVAVLAKHAVRGGTYHLLLRRLALGAVLTARRRIAVREYLEALRAGAGMLLGSNEAGTIRLHTVAAPSMEWREAGS